MKVYVTNEGKRYHAYAECPSLNKWSRYWPIREVTIEEIAGARFPCQRCGAPHWLSVVPHQEASTP